MLYAEMTATLIAERQHAAKFARDLRDTARLVLGISPGLEAAARENVRQYLQAFRRTEARRIRVLENVCTDLFHSAEVQLHFTDGSTRTVRCELDGDRWHDTTATQWTPMLEGIGANLAVRLIVDAAWLEWTRDGLVLQGMHVQTTRAYTATVYWNHTPIEMKVECTGDRWMHICAPQPTPLGEALTPHQAIQQAAEQLADEAWVDAEIKLDVSHINYHF